MGLEGMLAGATLLSGLAALWYFWERIPGGQAPPLKVPKETPDWSSQELGRESGSATSDENWTGMPSTTIFGWRMARGFPGGRGWVLLEEEDSVERLGVLLAPPLTREKGEGMSWAPMWWFRAGRSSSIESFRRLSPTTCLIDCLELKVHRIAAWRHHDERREFVYVETMGMEATGLYPSRAEDKHVPMQSEEYAIYGSHLITLEEHEDGHAVIDGDVVRTEGSEYRMRLVYPTNVVITGLGSPINSVEFDRISGPILDGILEESYGLDDLKDAVLALPQKELDVGWP